MTFEQTAAGALTVAGVLSVAAAGTIKFGNAADTDLYRLAANSLATDGALTVYGSAGLACAGPVDVTRPGSGIKVKEGSNCKQGVATLAAGTVTVGNTAVTASSRILLTVQQPGGGTVGSPYVSARTAGTSFTIKSTSGTDSSTVAYFISEPG